MSLKDNFNQAIKEILKGEGMVGDDLSKSSVKKRTEIDKFMGESAVPESASVKESLAPDTSAQSYGTSFGEAVPPSADDFRQAVQRRSPDPFAKEPQQEQEQPAKTNNNTNFNRFEYQTAEDTYTAPPPPPPPQRMPSGTPYGAMGFSGSGAGFPPSGGYTPPGGGFRGGRPPETPYYETEETTVISRNTRISGDISSFANVNVDGSVQGDIKLTKNISVSGKVVGNIECNNAVMTGAQMQGSISSKGQVQIDHDSVLLGNIDTQYLDLNGRIKGNVDVGGKAEFKNDAVIVGDITASTISVIDGAVIKGYVNTTFMQESTSNVFPEAITVGEV